MWSLTSVVKPCSRANHYDRFVISNVPLFSRMIAKESISLLVTVPCNMIQSWVVSWPEPVPDIRSQAGTGITNLIAVLPALRIKKGIDGPVFTSLGRNRIFTWHLRSLLARGFVQLYGTISNKCKILWRDYSEFVNNSDCWENFGLPQTNFNVFICLEGGLSGKKKVDPKHLPVSKIKIWRHNG